MDGFVVGVDLGGTKMAGAVVDDIGTVGEVRTVATPARCGPDAILDAVAQLVTRVWNDAVASSPAGKLRGVGIGTAGVVDVRTGVIVSSTDALTGWAGTDVAAGVRRRIGPLVGLGPVHVENDVDAHAGGEAWKGAAAGASSALVVAVGTGVGGAVLLDGRALRGAHHVAGEIGHLPTPGAEGLRCSCGRTGHLEALGAGPALHRQYLRLGGDPHSLDARDVVARADAGEPAAVQAVHDSAAAVGRGIAGIVTVLDPEVVVIGGGLIGAGERWWRAMEQSLRAELIDALADV
ncbi:MAG: ROK family protein, partial [Actinomycetota bacterium]|nr:ROK family protein [Actinomycetota bacterium]